MPSLQIPPFDLLPPTLCPEHDVIWSGIPLWVTCAGRLLPALSLAARAALPLLWDAGGTGDQVILAGTWWQDIFTGASSGSLCKPRFSPAGLELLHPQNTEPARTGLPVRSGRFLSHVGRLNAAVTFSLPHLDPRGAGWEHFNYNGCSISSLQCGWWKASDQDSCKFKA